jgi:hypothetical protein
VWAAENPHVYREEPLHPLKVGVWCAISRRRIIGPIFFEDTVNTQVYVNIFDTFVNQLDDEELQRGFFQQDGATFNTSNDSIAEIESFLSTESSPKDCGHHDDLTEPRQTSSYEAFS